MMGIDNWSPSIFFSPVENCTSRVRSSWTRWRWTHRTPRPTCCSRPGSPVSPCPTRSTKRTSSPCWTRPSVSSRYVSYPGHRSGSLIFPICVISSSDEVNISWLRVETMDTRLKKRIFSKLLEDSDFSWYIPMLSSSKYRCLFLGINSWPKRSLWS